ncbi:carbohydrate-binding family 9-like protein [uncultured Algibacter sp.]|uniref:carbohydrate-binding family 9-like protein n=1 Tax=uncultured Algibacter sp. TaxID=298659 RepID=UPI0026112D34|nr:carbohydrate-binding family 9-like protein [uncultured Algibacter sp.]
MILKIEKTLILTIVCLVSITNNWGQEYKLSLDERPLYRVKKTHEDIVVDGKLNETSWGLAESRTFNHHYFTQEPNDKQKTTFRILWDDKTIYLFYSSKDKYLTATEKEKDGTPFLDDCAELFLIPIPNSLNMHFCFEINLYEAKNDIIFINNFYNGNDAVVKAFNPDYQVKVITQGTINDNSDIDKGWTMEIAIPIETFRGSTSFHPVQTGTQWAFMALRQERNELKQGRRVISSIFPIEDIKKGVHQPNMFGLLEFID